MKAPSLRIGSLSLQGVGLLSHETSVVMRRAQCSCSIGNAEGASTTLNVLTLAPSRQRGKIRLRNLKRQSSVPGVCIERSQTPVNCVVKFQRLDIVEIILRWV